VEMGTTEQGAAVLLPEEPEQPHVRRDFPYPPETSDVHHEIEMVAVLSKGGKNIAVADALGHVFGYGVGLDMTRRDLQGEAKKLGRPGRSARRSSTPRPAARSSRRARSATRTTAPSGSRSTARSASRATSTR